MYFCLFLLDIGDLLSKKNEFTTEGFAVRRKNTLRFLR
jgi:hypothetical protein